MPSRLAPSSNSYWQLSRAPRYSLLFALPLLALYELLAAALGGPRGEGVRNGAEVLLDAAVGLVAGPWASLAVVAIVVVVCVTLAGIDLRRHRGGLRLRVFGLMLAESLGLAAAGGLLLGVLTARVLHYVAPHLAIAAPRAGLAAMSAPTKVMLALGAGLFEEIVFRVLLVGALAYAARRVTGMRATTAGLAASLVGAVVFSAAHYVGAYGDVLTLQSFVFRALAGLFFSVLFVTRGFGIAAWTHAIYDVLVMVVA